MSDKKVATTVYLTVDQRDKLRTLSSKTRVPASEYIRQGVDMVLVRHEHLLPGQLTLLSRLPGEGIGLPAEGIGPADEELTDET